MGTEVFDCLAELSRVTGSNLNPKKALVCVNESFMWNQAKCFCRVKYLVDSPIKYALFRKQVSSPPKRLFIQHQTIRQIVSCIFVWSLCHITWTREFQANEFVRSKNIIPIVDAINEENENCEIPNSLGRKCPLKEMSKYQCGIAELDYEIPELERNKNYLNSFVPWYPPLPASSSSSSLNNECYKDTRNISGSSMGCWNRWCFLLKCFFTSNLMFFYIKVPDLC